MISCQEAINQLWEYLDGTLDEEDRQAIDEHLSRCRRCCGDLEFAEELRRFLVASGREEVPADVIKRLNATLREVSGG
jgi:mycothiol system anti-sigma-R factor